MPEKVACFLMSWITGDKGQFLVDFYITVFCLFSCIRRFIYLFIIWSSEIHKDIQVTRSDEEVDVLLTKRCT